MLNSFKSRPEVQPALRVAERMTSQIEAAKYDGATNTETLELLERPKDEVLEVLRAYDNLRDYIRYVAKETQATKKWSKEEVQLHRIAQDTHRSSHSQYWQECTIKNKHLGPEEVGRLKGVSVEETGACVLTLLGIVIFIAHMMNIKTDPTVNYRYPEALLIYLYPASLVVNACLYIRGRYFKLLEPNVEKPWREEHLRCVKESIRAWVQRNRMRILGREKLEKTIMRHQESFAWYIVSAGSDSKFRGVEYSRRRNGAIVVMVFWLHYACGTLVHLVVYKWMEPEDPDKLLWIILGVVASVIFVYLQVSFHGTGHLTPERLGRGWRMTELGMGTRENFYNGADTENAETIEERFRWWIDNLVRSDQETSKNHEDAKIQCMVDCINNKLQGRRKGVDGTGKFFENQNYANTEAG